MDGEKEIQNEMLAENYTQVDSDKKVHKPHIKLAQHTKVILFVAYVAFAIFLLANMR